MPEHADAVINNPDGALTFTPGTRCRCEHRQLRGGLYLPGEPHGNTSAVCHSTMTVLGQPDFRATHSSTPASTTRRSPKRCCFTVQALTTARFAAISFHYF